MNFRLCPIPSVHFREKKLKKWSPLWTGAQSLKLNKPVLFSSCKRMTMPKIPWTCLVLWAFRNCLPRPCPDLPIFFEVFTQCTATMSFTMMFILPTLSYPKIPDKWNSLILAFHFKSIRRTSLRKTLWLTCRSSNKPILHGEFLSDNFYFRNGHCTMRKSKICLLQLNSFAGTRPSFANTISQNGKAHPTETLQAINGSHFWHRMLLHGGHSCKWDPSLISNMRSAIKIWLGCTPSFKKSNQSCHNPSKSHGQSKQ